MRGINKVILVGTLGRDPETKTFPSGGSVTTFSIATSEVWTDKTTGERREQTEWHRIVLSNRLGEVAQQYLRKGSKVYIEGSLRTRQWKDQQTGQDRSITEIRGDNMQMLDSRPTNGTYSDPSAPYAQPQPDYGYSHQNQGGYGQPQGGYGQPQSGYASGQQNFAGQQGHFNQQPTAPVTPAPNASPVHTASPSPVPSSAEPDLDDDLPF